MLGGRSGGWNEKEREGWMRLNKEGIEKWKKKERIKEKNKRMEGKWDRASNVGNVKGRKGKCYPSYLRKYFLNLHKCFQV